jgi:hypothetical protein
MNNYFHSSFSHQTSPLMNSRCSHCRKYSCQINFIVPWISSQQNSNEQQDIVDQRIQEMISKSIEEINIDKD